MMILDNALRAREQDGRPIRVGMIGAGFMGRGIANQIINSTVGMRLAAISNRTVDRAAAAYKYASETLQPVQADSQPDLDDAIHRGVPVVTGDAMLLCRAAELDVLIDVTGAVEFGAHLVLEAFRHGKHVILMNAELDATLGPLLQVYARRHG